MSEFLRGTFIDPELTQGRGQRVIGTARDCARVIFWDIAVGGAYMAPMTSKEFGSIQEKRRQATEELAGNSLIRKLDADIRREQRHNRKHQV